MFWLRLLILLTSSLVFAATLIACGDDAVESCDTDPSNASGDDDSQGDADVEGGEDEDEEDEAFFRECEEDVTPEDDDGDEDEDGWPDEATDEEAEVLRLINIERQKGATCRGTPMAPVGPVQMDDRLVRAARLHSQDMKTRDYFSHQSPEGEGPRERMDAQGFRGNGWAENIAMGQRDAAAAVHAWMTSNAGHCENIMNGSWNVVGVGYAAPYWTLKLASAK